MRKILFVTGGLGRGGAQRVITLLANEYVKNEWSVHMAMLLDNRIGYQINKDIVLHDLVRKGNYIKNVFGWVSDLKKLLKSEQPDIVLSFVGRVNIITMLAEQGTNIPIVISERNDPAHDRRSGLEIKLCKYFYGKADLVVFQTNYQKSFYGKHCEKNSVIIGNPIAAPIYRGKHNSQDIISVGKLMEQKNHPMLIKAFAKIADEYPNRKVHIFGDGELYKELQNLINELGMVGRVILEGNTDQVFDAFHKYQYFVMTSNYEGMSNALLEAMLSGMTCISTAWNGIEDIIKDGINGYLVPVGDENILADKLRRVFDSDNKLISKAGIQTANIYKTENIISRWFEALNSVL